MTDDFKKRFRHIVAVWGRCMSEPSNVREIADFLRGRPDEHQRQLASELLREALEQTEPPADPDHETSRWGQTMLDPLHIIALADAFETQSDAEQEMLLARVRRQNAQVIKQMSYDLFLSMLRAAAN